jgi:hypothetical protein
MNRILLTGAFLVFALTVTAQKHPLELSLFLGAANYQGDLAESRIELAETQSAIGAALIYPLNRFVEIRPMLTRTKLSGDDNNNQNLTFRQFSFEAELFEAALQLKWHPFGKGKKTPYGLDYKLISPYLYGGAALTVADAVVNANNTPDNILQEPFPEEFDTANFFALPVGAGLRIGKLEPAVIHLELGWRSVFSDYLDGVSNNGRREGSDWYVIGGIHIGFLIDAPEVQCKF